MSSPNPYATPKAAVADAVAVQSNFIPTGRTVPAGQGWTWIVQGWELFMKQPGIWVALVVLFAVIFVVLAIIPIIGSIAIIVLAPVFTGGMVLGCRALDQGGQLEIGHLFAGFRERFGSLVSVGLIYLAASIAIALVVGLVTGAGLWALLGGGADAVRVGAAGLTALLAILVMMALMIPVFMAIWFAPPLVLFHEQGAGEAMKNSFIACLKNIVPFLVYGAILFVLAILASIPLGAGWLLLGPVMVGSLYAAYRDIFFE